MAFEGAAWASAKSLIVQLVTAGESPGGRPAIVLEGPDGSVVRADLADDGQLPDVRSGDGTWTAPLWIEGEEYRVTIEAAGVGRSAGGVSWDEASVERELVLRLTGGQLSVMRTELGPDLVLSGSMAVPGGEREGGRSPSFAQGAASVAEAPAPAAASAEAAAGPVADAPGSATSIPVLLGPGSQTGNDGARLVFDPFPGQVTDDDATGQGSEWGIGSYPRTDGGRPWVWLAAFAAMVVLMAMAWRTSRAVRVRVDRARSIPTPSPHAPLVAHGFPSLSDGLSWWTVSADDLEALAEPLLATLARHHRVLYAAPSSFPPPRVHGGPVYPVTDTRPMRIAAVAEAMAQDPHPPVAVLVVAVDMVDLGLSELAASMPPEVGGVVLVVDPAVARLPQVACALDGDAWLLTCRGRTARVRGGVDGFEVLDVSRDSRDTGERPSMGIAGE